MPRTWKLDACLVGGMHMAVYEEMRPKAQQCLGHATPGLTGVGKCVFRPAHRVAVKDLGHPRGRPGSVGALVGQENIGPPVMDNSFHVLVCDGFARPPVGICIA